MNTLKIAGITVVVVLALAVLGAGFAFAQASTPTPGGGYGGYPAGGMMGGYGGGMLGGYGSYPGGMMGAFGQDGDGYQWMDDMHQWMQVSGGMHTLVWDGLAEALGLTPDQLSTELASGKTLAQIAETQGVSQEQMADTLEASVRAGLDQAVADGTLTQEQADWMLNHMEGNFGWMVTHMGSGSGIGPGGCYGVFNPQDNS